MIMYKLSAFFAVMDKSIVINKKMKFRLFRFKPHSVHIFRNKEMLFSYHLQTRKIDYIILKSGYAPGLLSIYDGPGLMFKIFESNTMVETSTFQCVVQILTLAERNYTNSSLYGDESIQFYSKKLKRRTNIKLLNGMNHEDIIIPDYVCHHFPCVIHFQAKSGNQVNVSVSHVKYVGEESLECKYAGLVAVEELPNEYKESTTLCSDHAASRRQSRNFYSQNSSLTLVLYWYETYSKINATLNISQSPCKTVWLDDCMVTSLCNPFITNHDECNNYLRKIARFSNATLRFELGFMARFYFSLPNEECIVIQIFHENAKLTSGFPEIDNHQSCHVNLGPDQILVPVGRITYTILGSLNNYVTKAEYMDQLTFLGIADEFCFTHRDMEHIKCQKDLDTPMIHPNPDEYLANLAGSGSGYKSGLSDNHSFNSLRFNKVQDIFVYAVTETPTHTKSLVLLTVLYLRTKSWIDFIIQNKVAQYDAARYPSETISLFGKKYSFKKVRSSISNVLLLRLSKKKLKENMDIKINIYCNFVLEYKGQIITWVSMMTVLEDYFKKIISVPRIIQEMSFFFPQKINLAVRNNYALKAMWIQDVYDKYSYFTRMEPKPCIRNINFIQESMNCLSFSAPSVDDTTCVKYTIFNNIVQPNQSPDWNKQNLFSWNKASWLCERTGGSLPYFSSRESLDQLVAVMKLSEYFYQFEGIFIGLHAGAENRVRSLAMLSRQYNVTNITFTGSAMVNWSVGLL